MKPSRLKKVVTISEVSELDGWSGFLRRHLNTISTVVLLILAGVMFVRWRTRVAENAKIQIGTDLSNAQAQVSRLRPDKLSPNQPPADLIKMIQQTETQASSALTSVVTSTDADDRMRAEAFILRGDLYWYLANLPPLPGSNSEPSLRLTESTDTLLTKASDSYQQVIKDPAYTSQHEQINSAHLGLAAIAENRLDWDTAGKEFNLVSNDPDALPLLKETAVLQLKQIDTIKQPLYLAPPSGAATSQPTTTPALPFGPFLPPATTLPTTVPTTMPAVH